MSEMQQTIDTDRNESGLEDLEICLKAMTLGRKPRPLKLSMLFELKLMDVLERKLKDAGYVYPMWVEPQLPCDNDESFVVILNSWYTEYDKVLQTHPSRKVGKLVVSQYYIDEEHRRMLYYAHWRRDTEKGVRYWTPERKALISTDPKMALLWSKWLAWVPPPPKYLAEPTLPIDMIVDMQVEVKQVSTPTSAPTEWPKPEFRAKVKDVKVRYVKGGKK